MLNLVCHACDHPTCSAVAVSLSDQRFVFELIPSRQVYFLHRKISPAPDYLQKWFTTQNVRFEERINNHIPNMDTLFLHHSQNMSFASATLSNFIYTKGAWLSFSFMHSQYMFFESATLSSLIFTTVTCISFSFMHSQYMSSEIGFDRSFKITFRTWILYSFMHSQHMGSETGFA